MDRDEFKKHTGLRPDDLQLLKSVPLFSKLEVDVMKDLLQDSSVRHYPRDTILFFQGDAADRFCVIFEGWVKLFRQTADGHESVLHLSGPKDSFAEAAIFDTHDFQAIEISVNQMFFRELIPFEIYHQPFFDIELLKIITFNSQTLANSTCAKVFV